MRINRRPAGFVIPSAGHSAKTAVRSRLGSQNQTWRISADRPARDGPALRLYSRDAYDWTARLAAIAAAAERMKAKSFTIDGEAVVLGPDGLSRFEELYRRGAARTAILYAFDLIEHDGEDLRARPFLERKAALVTRIAEFGSATGVSWARYVVIAVGKPSDIVNFEEAISSVRSPSVPVNTQRAVGSSFSMSLTNTSSKPSS
jgi:hypothetical protein